MVREKSHKTNFKKKGNRKGNFAAKANRNWKNCSQCKKEKNGIYLPAVALLVFAGIRPCEVRRLTWQDIDLQENTIMVRLLCSKTGGVCQVEIMPQLKRILLSYKQKPQQKICPATGSGDGLRFGIILGLAAAGCKRFCGTHTPVFLTSVLRIWRACN
ncbi:MAG: hypothetical protein SPI34_00995 [Opitutales bacterium]|nr:hypothetical protein [Opitutales bacterium]